jgi:hypothetical protein
VALAVALLAAWLIADPRTPDLAAQVYRANLFGSHGFTLWDARWYGGHHLPGYSLLFPAFGSWLGVRVVGALAALASVVLFERLVVGASGGSARWGAALFAVGAVGDVWIGRLSFALGVSFALGAALALSRRRTMVAVALAFLCAAASPVAGALLALGGLTVSLHRRSLRFVVVLGAPVGVVVGTLALLFGEGGWEPFPIRSFAATAIVGVAFVVALPARERMLRVGGVLFLAACLACLLVHTPMGSNVARYGVLLEGPLLLASVFGDAGSSRLRSWRLAVVALITVWVVWGPVRETAAVWGSPATRASYYLPVERYLAGAPVRVEVPLTRSHWEAALLAPHVSLARGWEKQLEERYDGVLLSHGLDAASYRAWLLREAVAYVALPDVPLDGSSAAEGRLIGSGLPYLRLVFASAHWRVYRVLGATPLASGPGRLAALDSDGFAVAAVSSGRFVVRVRYSRYLTVTGGEGCVGPASGGWTSVRAYGAGLVSVAARFSLSRALGGDGAACRVSG